MKIANQLLAPAVVIASALWLTSCGPSTKTIECYDFSFTAPGVIEMSNQEMSERHAVNTCAYFTDDKGEDIASVEVIYANLNPRIVLEDYYGEAEPAETEGMYVSSDDFGTMYAFNQDSCTVVLLLLHNCQLTVNDFTDWKINHDYEAAARKCDHVATNDRPFLYETYGRFSSNIDFAITDDNIVMRQFRYDPGENILDVVVLLRSMGKDEYMANRESNEEYIASRVMSFADETGLYRTYCRSKEAPVEIRVSDVWGGALPVITCELKAMAMDVPEDDF